MELNINYIINSLSSLLPEVAVTLALALIVIVDLIMGKNKKLLPYISIAGILVAGYFVIDQFGMNGFALAVDGGRGMIVVDSFGAFFKTIIVFTSIVVVLFSLSSKEIIENSDRHGEYYTLIFGMILGMFFMVSATDFILLYLAIELLSLSSYVLAGFAKHTMRNAEASLKYIIYGGVSSGIMLFGISIIFGITGSTNLYEINSLMQAPQFQGLVGLLAGILIFVGIGFKISAAPFHFWTPDVYEGGPITITAYLSIASKAAGFALLIRFIKITFIDSINLQGYWTLVNVIDWQSFLILISILTMTLGNFAALWQNNLKRMLAYSSIAHAGYLLLGLAVLSNQGIIAILIYFAVYAFMNLGAFFIVMLIANKIGSEDMDDYDGLGFTSPLIGVSLTIFMVSLAGLPPTAGFIGKLYIFFALVDANMIVVALIALANSVVSLYYYLRVIKHMYLTRPNSQTVAVVPNKANTVLLMVLLLPIVILGLYFSPLVELAKTSVALFGF